MTAGLVHFDVRDRETLPERLRDVSLSGLSVRGGPLDAACVLAIVGSREAHPSLIEGARAIASACASRGIVVASGGALGVDAAAHEAALAHPDGVTWAVLGHGAPFVSPPSHAPLFARIAARGALVYPFPASQGPMRHTFPQRNSALVALADAVVVVQAGEGSGALDTARKTRAQGKPLWVVPPPAWIHAPGSTALLDDGARPLDRLEPMFRILDALAKSKRTDRAANPGEDLEARILAFIGDEPRHPDELVRALAVPVSALAQALLTLSLESVLVVAPDGRYRRCR